MKKNHIAAVIIIAIIAIFALAACNHAHNFEWNYDEDVHWKECACGEVNSRERHDYASDYIYDDTEHWRTCVCGKTGERGEHDFSVFGYDDTYHWEECSVCGAKREKTKHNVSAKWSNDDESHWHECECGYRQDETAHEFTDRTVREPKCSEEGVLLRTCSVCDKEVEKSIDKLPHVFGDDNKCIECGEDKPYYTYSDNGAYMYFGEYPQTKVNDNDLIRQLNDSYGKPDNGSGDWIAYDYAEDGEADYMWYTDVEMGENRYRGVYFDRYRPYSLDIAPSAENSGQDDNGYMPGEVYWFEFEPIRWRILTKNDEEALIMSDIILDSQPYQTNYYSRQYETRPIYYTSFGDAPEGTYANNYKYSTLREWLNDEFYDSAFDDYSRKNILLTEVSNSIATTGLNNPEFVCEDTEDYVFLLSQSDCVNEKYGFSRSLLEHSSRQLKTTDYSMSQGAYVSTSEFIGTGWWWTRSPRNISELLCGVYSAGRLDSEYRFFITACGVVPALTVKL